MFQVQELETENVKLRMRVVELEALRGHQPPPYSESNSTQPTLLKVKYFKNHWCSYMEMNHPFFSIYLQSNGTNMSDSQDSAPWRVYTGEAIFTIQCRVESIGTLKWLPWMGKKIHQSHREVPLTKKTTILPDDQKLGGLFLVINCGKGLLGKL